MTDVKTVTLTGGVEMPLLGFGTWQITGPAARDATLAALNVGYRHIDTATGYGNEAEVGRALHDSGIPR
jgi:2,5-diketo-D-gluconate reductase A